MSPSNQPSPDDHIDLASVLSECELVALAEAFGGTRLYLPAGVKPGHPLATALGHDVALALVKSIGAGTLRIPIARDLRARHYRDKGESYAQIARRLGMTEVGVQRMFKRMRPTSALS